MAISPEDQKLIRQTVEQGVEAGIKKAIASIPILTVRHSFSVEGWVLRRFPKVGPYAVSLVYIGGACAAILAIKEIGSGVYRYGTPVLNNSFAILDNVGAYVVDQPKGSTPLRLPADYPSPFIVTGSTGSNSVGGSSSLRLFNFPAGITAGATFIIPDDDKGKGKTA